MAAQPDMAAFREPYQVLVVGDLCFDYTARLTRHHEDELRFPFYFSHDKLQVFATQAPASPVADTPDALRQRENILYVLEKGVGLQSRATPTQLQWRLLRGSCFLIVWGSLSTCTPQMIEEIAASASAIQVPEQYICVVLRCLAESNQIGTITAELEQRSYRNVVQPEALSFAFRQNNQQPINRNASIASPKKFK